MVRCAPNPETCPGAHCAPCTTAEQRQTLDRAQCTTAWEGPVSGRATCAVCAGSPFARQAHCLTAGRSSRSLHAQCSTGVLVHSGQKRTVHRCLGTPFGPPWHVHKPWKTPPSGVAHLPQTAHGSRNAACAPRTDAKRSPSGIRARCTAGKNMGGWGLCTCQSAMRKRHDGRTLGLARLDHAGLRFRRCQRQRRTSGSRDGGRACSTPGIASDAQ
jgi:hypothetical protein